MVADHQGGWHQGGMIQPGTFHNLPFREWLVPVCMDDLIE
jgi:hypothetical protein